MQSLRGNNLLPVLYLLTLMCQICIGTYEIRMKCPKECKCFRDQNLARCSNHGQNLSHIPDLPMYVQELLLEHDYFPKLTRALFKPLEHHVITNLTFKASKIREIDEYSFDDLETLQTLTLSLNSKLDIDSLKRSLIHVYGSPMPSLSFDANGWKESHLKTKIFANVKGRPMDFLSLKRNLFKRIPEGSFHGLGNLSTMILAKNSLSSCGTALRELISITELDLSKNQLTNCDVENLPKSIRKLVLFNNKFVAIPDLCNRNGSITLKKFQELQIHRNQITSLNHESFRCMPYLRTLILKQNFIARYGSNDFSMLNRLRFLDLGKMKISVLAIAENAFSFPSLEIFKFDNNGFKFGMYEYLKHPIFRKCLKLKYLDISRNRLTLRPGDGEYLFGGLHGLVELRLQHVDWHVIPDGFFNIFKALRKIDLLGNQILSFNRSLFSKISTIEEINLSQNRISYVTKQSFSPALLKSLKVIDMSSNPFICDCNILWFRDWIHSTHIKVKNYPKLYLCAMPPETRGTELRNFTLTKEECEVKSELVPFVVGAVSVCLFGTLALAGVYKNRWHIRYWIYLLKYKRSKYDRIRNEESFMFDAFVIYCEDDNEWVIRTFVQKMEKEEGLKLCIHHRDFDVGKIIVENIIDCMTESRFAVVVLSNDFCKSQWCNFELLIAQNRWLNDQSDPLLLVMLEEVSSKHMNAVLRALITTTTYIMWSEEEEAQYLFWSQITSALKK